jgi:hypothetical protein
MFPQYPGLGPIESQIEHSRRQAEAHLAASRRSDRERARRDEAARAQAAQERRRRDLMLLLNP